MQNIELDNNLFLFLEPHNKMLRLVISNGEMEVACRKETPRNLHLFITEGQSTLFKGRLQLHKSENSIIVLLKGSTLGGCH
jgi:hypothetical protein